MMNLNLGFIFNEQGELINHRPLLKVLVNPFMRPFEKCIASNIDRKHMTVKYIIQDCEYVTLLEGLKGIRYVMPEKGYRLKKHTIW